MLSWHEPHTARVGRVYQIAASEAVVSWQVVQLRMSCGYVMPDQSPPAMYALPLGRLAALWSLWKKILPLKVSPLAESLLTWSLWHCMQSSTSRRVPPCRPSGSWQLLQVLATAIAPQVAAGAAPSGRKSMRTLSA